MKKIYVSGSLAFDRIMNFPGYFKDNILPDKIHNLDVSFNIDKLRENFGGTAGNIAYNLSLLDVKSTVIGSVGKDFAKYQGYLEERRIDTKGIEVDKNDFTASAHIITDQANNQITGFYMGAMQRDTKYEIKKGDLLIISPGNIHDMLRYQTQAQNIKMPYIFDPGQTLPFFQPEELRTLVNGAKMLISNDYELELVIKKTGYKYEEILEICDIVITTKGAKGSLIKKKGEAEINVKSVKPYKVADPTGAGDAYRAGFIYGYVNDKDLETCGKLASLAAKYCIEEYGTQEHFYTMYEFKEEYKTIFKN